MVKSGVVVAIHVAGVRGDPCGAVRWTAVHTVNVKKCICWCLSIIECYVGVFIGPYILWIMPKKVIHLSYICT